MDPASLLRTAQIAKAIVANKHTRTFVVGLLVFGLAAVAFLVALPGMLATQLVTLTQQQHDSTQFSSIRDTSCGVALAADGARSTAFTSLSVGQVEVARVIWRTVRAERLPDYAAVIAISVAMQESSLGSSPGIDRPNEDGDAGVFQQRTLPGWYGTLAQVTDVEYATRAFLRGVDVTPAGVTAAQAAGVRPAGPVGYHIPGLVQVEHWESLSVVAAAQAVQRSAYPQKYAGHERTARGLVALYESGSPIDSARGRAAANSGLCGGGGAMASCPATGWAVESGLTPDALRVLRCGHQHFPQVQAWLGIGDRPANVDDDHQSGRAVDAMVPDWQTAEGEQLGRTIAEWAVANHARLGVSYVIWQARIWSVNHPDKGWRACGTEANCYAGPDATRAHRDHVHISVNGNTAADSGRGAGGVTLPMPQYVITATFGQCGSQWQACHTGLDFAAGVGTPIHAVMDGTVTYVGWGGAYGNLTKIDHGGLIGESWYAHQSSQTVTVGQQVRAGQQIGTVGGTGNVTGPHLHLEIRLIGRPVDPATWLASRGARP